MLGVDTADIVAGAGGLICDSVRAGLQVEAYLETLDDERALRVLGVSARPLPNASDFESDWPDAVFFSAAVHERNPGLRRLVAEAIRHRRAQIAVWGESGPAGPRNDLDSRIEHRLSTAAEAFKQHAMKAAGMAVQVSPTEPFRSGHRRPADNPPLLPLR